MSVRLSSRRTAVSVAAAACAIGSAVLVGGAATPVSAAPHDASRPAAFKVTSFSFSVFSVPVKSSTKKKLNYGLSLNHSSTSNSVSEDLAAGTESHYWSFNVTAKSFAVKAAKGTGTVNTLTQLKKYGRLKLTMTSAGKATKQSSGCTYKGGSITSRPVKLKGTTTFKTNSAWGVVGAHKLTLKGSLTTTYGNPTVHCPTSPTFCSSVGVSASYFANAGQSVEVFPVGKHSGEIFASRSKSLSSPKGASRYDQIQGSTPVLKVVKVSGKPTVKITSTSKVITGSATLTASAAPTTSTCKTTKESDYSATWKNGTKKLTFHERIEGSFVPSNGGFGSFDVITKK